MNVRFARQWVAALVTVIALYLSGVRTLGWPPLSHPVLISAWWAREGSLVGGFSLLRLVLLLAAAYWWAILTVAGLAVATGSDRLIAVLGRRRAVGTGRALHLALGASVAGAILAGCGTVIPHGVAVAGSAGHGRPGPAQPPTLANLGPWPTGSGPQSAGRTPTTTAPRTVAPPTTTSPPTTSPPTTSPTTASPPTTVHPVAPTTSPAKAPPKTAPPTTAPPTTAQPKTMAGAATWTVRPGDSLWSIAAATLRADPGAAGDRDLAAYWEAVVAANRRHLPDPGDPNLIFTGDVVVLPPVPGASRPD